MPQIVPSAGFTPPYCDYSAFTTDFDLSLLPSSPESDVPSSPTQLSPYLSLYPSSPPMLSNSLEDGILCDNIGFVNLKAKQVDDVNYEAEDEPLHTPLKKSLSAGFFDEKMDTKEKQEDPLIPTTVQTSTNYFASVIKQEPNFSLDFSQSSTVSDFPKLPQTTYAIKTEKTIDLQEALKETQYLQNLVQSQTKQYATLHSLLKGSNEAEGKAADHQLLRSVLRDTSFQKKFNIKPFEIPVTKVVKMEDTGKGREEGGAEIVEELTQERMDPVFSLAIEQIQKEVENTCSVLGLARDPAEWTSDDVKAWLLWTVRQYALPMINVDSFDMDGQAFSHLTEEEFQERTPQSGSTLHAHLEIWKAAASCGECSTSSQVASTSSVDYTSVQWSPTMQSMHSSGSSTGGDLSDEEDDDMGARGSAATPSQATPGAAGPSQGTQTSGKTRGGSGSHIHLWQFLKELLASPQLHGSCIRWLDRQKGVFKIEDSVRVARLWGKRKNRPAMNYDKLSRSIRQYYKKGIMKKTERSQRLVYQFCHPYSL